LWWIAIERSTNLGVVGVQGLDQEGDYESRLPSFLFLIPNSRLGELNPKFVLLCVLYVFDEIIRWNSWCTWWKLGVV